MKLIKNLQIGTKLILSFLLVALLCGIIGYTSLLNINTISKADMQLYSKNMTGIIYINKIAVFFQRLKYNAVKLVITDAGHQQQDALEKLDIYQDIINENINEYENKILDKEEEDFSTLTTYLNQYCEHIETVKTSFESGNTDGAISTILNVLPISGNKIEEKIDSLISYNEIEAQLKSQQNNQVVQVATYIMLGIVSFSFIAAVLLGLFISRSISIPVKQLSAAAGKLARGDTNFKLNIKTKDEVGHLSEAFTKMAEAIGNLINEANMLTQAAQEGRLNVRADEFRHQGDYRKIIQGVNKTLDAVIAPIEESSNVLAEVSQGNLGSIVTSDFNGDHARIKEAINNTVNAMKGYIEEISVVLAGMARGDFTSEITIDFKGDFSCLKDSINDIIRSLSTTLLEINVSADQVASGTKQISEGSQTISQGATEQASALEQLSASITQISAQTKQNAENAAYADDLSFDAKKAAIDGNAHMTNMQSAMTAINDSSIKISNIIKVVDDIAFQTNILALNAAVEAAGAGIHGKGFAVVAEEVRNLATRSSEAAKETSELIERSISNVEIGTKISNETAKALKIVLTSIDKIVDLSSGISRASNEQATAIAEVNHGLDQLSVVVQTNSATAQEAAAASEELSSQADILKKMVNQFVIRKEYKKIKNNYGK